MLKSFSTWFNADYYCYYYIIIIIEKSIGIFTWFTQARFRTSWFFFHGEKVTVKHMGSIGSIGSTGVEYDLLDRNCGHFCNELCQASGAPGNAVRCWKSGASNACTINKFYMSYIYLIYLIDLIYILYIFYISYISSIYLLYILYILYISYISYISYI